jgi:hypothetical protein
MIEIGDNLTFAGLVDAAYEGLLKREADPEARSEYIRLLESHLLTPAAFLSYITSIDEFFSRCRPANPGRAIASLYSGEDAFGDPFNWFSGTGRIVFFHFPKTAGVSLLKLLTRQFHPLQLGHGWRRTLNGLEAGQWQQLFSWHMTWDEYCAIPDPKFSITCLRDPCERLLSLYSFLSKVEPAGRFGAATDIARRCSPEDFFDCQDPAVRNEIDNVYVRYLSHAMISSDGTDPLEKRTAEHLELAFKRAQSFQALFFLDEVVGTSYLPTRVSHVLNEFFGQKLEWRLPHENTTQPIVQRPMLTTRLRASIERNTWVDKMLVERLRNSVIRCSTDSNC